MSRKKEEKKKTDEEYISFDPPAYLSIGLDLLDWAINDGLGLPFGRLIRISGKPGVGKSSLAEQIMASYLNKELGDVYLMEGEGKAHLGDYMKTAFGVANLGRLKGLRPPTLGALWSKLEELSWEKDEGLFIIDSLSSFGEPDIDKKGELKSITEAQRLGLEAVKNTEAMKRGFYRRIADKKIIILTVNHLRESIGYGGEHEPGGTANHFQSSLDFKVKIEALLEDKENSLTLGQIVSFEITRNMVGIPYRKVSIPLYYGLGWANEESIVDLGIKKGTISGGGGWYKLSDTVEAKKYRKQEIVQLMKEDREFSQEIKNKCLQ